MKNQCAPSVGSQFDQDTWNERLAGAVARLKGYGEATDRALQRALKNYKSTLPKVNSIAEQEPESYDAMTRKQLAAHIQLTLKTRPKIDAVALAGSIEMFRVLKGLSFHQFPAGRDSNANKSRWQKVTEEVGLKDVDQLATALTKRSF